MAGKYGFALHTTTPELGLAINYLPEDQDQVEDIERSQVWNLQRQVSNLLHEYLVEFIKPQTWQDLAFIAVAAGPGGFTGTRIGMVAARTFAQQLNIPVFAVSTLAALAWQASRTNPQNTLDKANIAIQMPAQRGQLFGAIYQINHQNLQISPLLPDTIFTPSAWQTQLDAEKYPYHLVEADAGLAATVTSILALANLEYRQGKRPDWSQARPFYGQNPV